MIGFSDFELHQQIGQLALDERVPAQEVIRKGIKMYLQFLDMGQIAFFKKMARRMDGSRRSLERICSETVPVEFDELEIEEREVLDKEISDLELSKRPINCLEKQGIRYVGQLIKMDKSEVSKIKGLGHRCLSEIALMLHNHGLCFNAPITGWLPPNQRMQPRENIDGKQ